MKRFLGLRPQQIPDRQGSKREQGDVPGHGDMAVAQKRGSQSQASPRADQNKKKNCEDAGEIP